MGLLACSQACSTIAYRLTINKEQRNVQLSVIWTMEREEIEDRGGGRKLEVKSIQYLSQLRRFTTCSINKNFILFDLTCGCLKVQPEIFVQFDSIPPSANLFHTNVDTQNMTLAHLTCSTDLLFKFSWLEKGFSHWIHVNVRSNLSRSALSPWLAAMTKCMPTPRASSAQPIVFPLFICLRQAGGQKRK